MVDDGENRLLKQAFIASAYFSIGVIVGMVGFRLSDTNRSSDVATARLAEALSKPLNLQVSLSSPTPAVRGSKLFDLFANEAATALDTAARTSQEPAKVAAVAANEFVKGLSGEAGKKLVDGFSELIARKFKPSIDKAKDIQVISTFLVTNNIVSVPPPGGQVTSPFARMTDRVMFDIDKASLTPLANTTIGKLRDFAIINPGAIILLTGNADTLGSERRNSDLARQRSIAVRERLLSAGGIAANRVFVSDHGDSSLPVVTGGNTAEQQNRSVTVEVRE